MLICIIAAAAAIGVVVLAAVAFRLLGRGANDRDPKGATAGHAGGMLSAFSPARLRHRGGRAMDDGGRGSPEHLRREPGDRPGLLVGFRAARARTGPGANELRGYVVLVRATEWPLMGKGQLSPQGWTLLDTLRGRSLGCG